MMGIRGFRTKKACKEGAIGKDASGLFIETSIFGAEYKGDGKYCVVGPSPQDRKWYAELTVSGGKVVKVT